MSMAEALGYRCYGAIFATLICLIVGGATKDSMSVQFQTATILYVNPDYLGPSAWARVSRKSRNSVPVFNAMFPVIQEIPRETEMRYQVFQKTRNAWRPLMKSEMLVCSVLGTNIGLFRHILDRTNCPRKCPLKVANYTFRDVTVQYSDMPPALPSADFRIKFSGVASKMNLLVFNVDIKLDKKGTAGGQVSDALAVASINSTLG